MYISEKKQGKKKEKESRAGTERSDLHFDDVEVGGVDGGVAVPVHHEVVRAILVEADRIDPQLAVIHLILRVCASRPCELVSRTAGREGRGRVPSVSKLAVSQYFLCFLRAAHARG
jgi:hypothetical protein